jgi:hypothetical protein
MYYPNEVVIYYNEDNDWVILAHGRSWDDPRINYIIHNMTDEQRSRVTLATTEPYEQ